MAGDGTEGIVIRDKVDLRSVDELVPYARNARTHSDEQVEEIARSIREFGWNSPVLVDAKGGIIAGHGRVMAAKKLGLARVPVIDASDLTEAQCRAYILADNQIGLNAGWDKKLLGFELADLGVAGFDTSLTGFSATDINAYMSALTLTDEPEDEAASAAENELPEVEDVIVTRPGDIWRVGDHRLLCADATNRAEIDRMMNGELAQMCFTSPPYAAQRDYKTGGIGDWDNLMQGVMSALPMRADGQVLINLGLVHRQHEVMPYWEGWIKWMRVCAWRFFGWYVWDQGSGVPGDWAGRFAPSFEFIFHFNRETRYPNKIIPCKNAGDIKVGKGLRQKDGKRRDWAHNHKAIQAYRIPDNLIKITRQAGPIGEGIDHPAVFPVALPEFMMLAYSNPGDVCYEPFCGSGTSLIAAEKTRRRLRAVEIAPTYVDVALERFRRLYPDTPITLADTDEPFSAVAARRERRANLETEEQ